MPNLNLSDWSWDEIAQYYPSIYKQYGPGSPNWVEPTTTPAPVATPAATALPGLPPTTYTPAYGGIPQVPDPTVTAGQAAAGNLANLGTLQDLAGRLNAFNIGQSILPYTTNLPGYTGMMEQQSANIRDMLAGRVPQDVLQQIVQRGMERGIAMGSPLSPNANAAWLRALGLTSLGLQEQGMTALQRAIGEIPQVPLYDVTRGFVDPNTMQQAAAAAALYASMPDPAAAAEAARATALAGLNRGAGAVGMPAVSSLNRGLTPAVTTPPDYVGRPGGVANPPGLASTAPGYWAGGQYIIPGFTQDPYAAWTDWYSGVQTPEPAMSFQDWFPPAYNVQQPMNWDQYIGDILGTPQTSLDWWSQQPAYTTPIGGYNLGYDVTPGTNWGDLGYTGTYPDWGGWGFAMPEPTWSTAWEPTATTYPDWGGTWGGYTTGPSDWLAGTGLSYDWTAGANTDWGWGGNAYDIGLNWGDYTW